MKFIDETTIEVAGGSGGNGCTAFRRERNKQFGGPSGGDGGRGGNVIVEGDKGLSTLFDLHERKSLRAEAGEHGQGRDRFGRSGRDIVQRVPIGTQLFDAETNELVADIVEDKQQVVVARGGDGGRGNMNFATPWDQAPTRSDPGTPGEKRKLRIHLKLIADVALVGYPNVGKSTLIAAVSRARPKIADYPFTTLVPNLGVVSLGADRSFVIADIPGLIEGASHGAGLGIRFLKHIERTRVLLHLVTIDPTPGREPLKDYETLLRELEAFDATLVTRPFVVAMTKLDIPEAQEAFKKVAKAFKRKKIDLHAISAATREGIDELLLELERKLNATPA